jgi:hypothetical protein
MTMSFLYDDGILPSTVCQIRDAKLTPSRRCHHVVISGDGTTRAEEADATTAATIILVKRMRSLVTRLLELPG